MTPAIANEDGILTLFILYTITDFEEVLKVKYFKTER